MVKCKIKQGEQETTLEAEVPISMSVKDAEVEFEKPMRLVMDGEGKVTVDLPATVYASKLRLQGEASIRTDEGFKIPRVRAPRRHGIQAKILEKLTEADYTSQELADELGLNIKQVDNAVYHLIEKGLVTRIGKKAHKAGVSRKDPNEVRSAGVAIVE